MKKRLITSTIPPLENRPTFKNITRLSVDEALQSLSKFCPMCYKIEPTDAALNEHLETYHKNNFTCKNAPGMSRLPKRAISRIIWCYFIQITSQLLFKILLQKISSTQPRKKSSSSPERNESFILSSQFDYRCKKRKSWKKLMIHELLNWYNCDIISVCMKYQLVITIWKIQYFFFSFVNYFSKEFLIEPHTE